MFEEIKADLRRLSPAGVASPRVLMAGLLSQGFQAILVYRWFCWLHRRGLPGQPFRFCCERFIEVTTGISIPAACRIGKGLRIHHFGGIIFHPTVEIGDNCTLYQGVTIGDRGGSGKAAKIGANVLIGAGAKIIGEITIGDNCVIGANTVVTKDMPPNTVAVGSPCQFRERKLDSGPLPIPPRTPPIPRVMDFRGTYKGGGGPDKTILNSAAQHDPARAYVLVTYLRQPRDDEFQIPAMARQLGINYVDFPDGSMFDRDCLTGLKRLIRQHRIQLVHAHDDKTLLYAWLLKLMVPGLKIMYTCHSHAAYRREEFPTLREYLCFRMRQKIRIFLMQRYLRPIITVSRDTKRRIVADGLKETEVAVLPNGIDVRAWCRDGASPVLRRELNLASHVPVIGTVARITPDKDLSTFYQVAEKVVSCIPEAIFLIVGDGYGKELELAREEVASRGLQRHVHFIGHRSDLRDVYVSFDVFLMTSRTEGMPNTLLEAMAMGIPSVATAVGGIPELLDEGRSGFLAPAGDVAGLAAHVVRLLRAPELREQFTAACRRRVTEDFSFALRVSRLEEYYTRFASQEPLQTLSETQQEGGRG